MPLITLCFVFWFAFCVYRGYKKGLWASLASLAALIAAYVASILWGSSLANQIQGLVGNPILENALAYVLVYFLVYLLVAGLLSVVMKRFRAGERRLAIAGAVFGGGVGALSGLIVIWALSFLYAALKLNPEINTPASMDSVMQGAPSLQQAAGALVGKASGMGAEAAGADPLQAGMLKKVVEQPYQSLQNMQRLGKSAELKSFLSDKQVQLALTRGNADELTDLYAFQQLVKMPELADLRQLALEQSQKEGGSELRDADKYLATRVSDVWQRVQALRGDEQFQAVLEDPEIQQLFKQQDYLSLMNNEKMQVLVQRVLNEEPLSAAGAERGMEGEPALEGEPVSSLEMENPELEGVNTVYKWRDADGKLHFSNLPPEDQE